MNKVVLEENTHDHPENNRPPVGALTLFKLSEGFLLLVCVACRDKTLRLRS